MNLKTLLGSGLSISARWSEIWNRKSYDLVKICLIVKETPQQGLSIYTIIMIIYFYF